MTYVEIRLCTTALKVAEVCQKPNLPGRLEFEAIRLEVTPPLKQSDASGGSTIRVCQLVRWQGDVTTPLNKGGSTYRGWGVVPIVRNHSAETTLHSTSADIRPACRR